MTSGSRPTSRRSSANMQEIRQALRAILSEDHRQAPDGYAAIRRNSLRLDHGQHPVDAETADVSQPSGDVGGDETNIQAGALG